MSLRDTVWITFSFLTEEARLGYSIAVSVPISMCPGASENSFLFKQLLPLEQLEQKVKILFWRMERRQILVLNILNVNASVSLITWCPFKITMWRQIRNEMPETLPFLLSHGHMKWTVFLLFINPTCVFRISFCRWSRRQATQAWLMTKKTH